MSHAKCNYTFDHYKSILKQGLLNNYTFKTCYEHFNKADEGELTCVIRHDVDIEPLRSIEFAKIENYLNIKSTYFFRIHANEYNPLSYEAIGVIKDIHSMGHEIGLHAEPIDIFNASDFSSDESLRLGKLILENITGSPIYGVASHNDLTPDNNLDYFKTDKYIRLGFSYEAYDNCLNLFNNSYYITDSHPWYWRTFINGDLTDEHKCICQYFSEKIAKIYCLTHTHTWYKHHYQRARY